MKRSEEKMSPKRTNGIVNPIPRRSAEHHGHREQGQKDSGELVHSLDQRTEDLLRELLDPCHVARLEQYRFRGSSNRVYLVPIDERTGGFVIVKLPAHHLPFFKRWVKSRLRDLLYGERGVYLPSEDFTREEVERYREWHCEGVRIPRLIETSLPGVRVIEGLPYPTFFTILSDAGTSDEAKLQVLAFVTASLSQQHTNALVKSKKSLVHRDPGPWNMLVDRERSEVYWYDLEFPAEYPGASLDMLLVRALRIFIFGVLDHLEHRLEEVVAVVVKQYELEPVLWALLRDLRNPWRAPVLKALQFLGIYRNGYGRRQRIARELERLLRQQAPAAGESYGDL